MDGASKAEPGVLEGEGRPDLQSQRAHQLKPRSAVAFDVEPFRKTDAVVAYFYHHALRHTAAP